MESISMYSGMSNTSKVSDLHIYQEDLNIF